MSFDEEVLEVGFPADITFNKRKAEAPDKRDTVVAALGGCAGEAAAPDYVVLRGGTAGDAGPAGAMQIDEDELVERLKSEFDAEEVS